jgi:diaminopimelate decarboxylase
LPSEEGAGGDALFVFDLDALENGMRSLVDAFPAHFMHCYAVKAAPMHFIVQTAARLGKRRLAFHGPLAGSCRSDCIRT